MGRRYFKISFREKQRAEFLNICMLKENRIISSYDHTVKSEYVVCNAFENTTESIVYTYFVYFLNKDFEPEDIFTLAPSLKHKLQLLELET